MRICFLLHEGSMYSGGQGVYASNLCRELTELGHEVHVVAGPPYPELADGITLHKLRNYNYHRLLATGRRFFYGRPVLDAFRILNLGELVTTRLGMYSVMGAFSIRAFERVRELHAEQPFDIVHDNQVLGYGTLLIKATGIPVVATVHHPLSVDRESRVREAPSLWGKARAVAFYPFFMQEVVARRIDKIVTVSAPAARSVQRALSLTDEQVAVVENGIDPDTWRPVPEVQRDPSLIVFVGNSEDENKGARYLIEALAMLRESGVEWELAVVDDRNRLRLLPRLALEHRVASISYTGRLTTDELVRLYNRAGLVVSPSLYEGFGLPVAEAMACEAPVVATTVGAHPQLVREGETGFLVPPGDAQALAEAMRRVLSDPAAGEQMGKAGRRWVASRFTWRRAADELLGTNVTQLPHAA